MELNKQQKLSEQHASETFAPMLSEDEKILCAVYCTFGQKEFSAPIGDTLAGYAACTSGGRLLIAVYSSICYSFSGVKTETYDLSLAKNIKIEKRIIGEYVIKADFASGNGDRKIKIQTAPKVLFNGFPDQEENLKKMLEILRKYDIGEGTMSNLIIRNETEADCKTVEKIIRNAFWDVNFPGCDEHYLAHILRKHEDFIPELDLVAELDGQIIGNIMYTKAALIGENGAEKEILTFGPVCIVPEFQRMGYGKRLIEFSFERAEKMGYEAVVIFGHPSNYISMGFKSCKKYNVSAGNDVYPCAMLVKELKQDSLSGGKWVYRESPAYNFDEKDAEEFDKQFEKREKGYRQSQEEFYIYSHSVIK